MNLTSLRYSEFEGEPRTWKVDGLTLREVNLLVGKNASGKTRTLNVIKGLAAILSQDKPLQYSSGDYETVFRHDSQILQYTLKYSNQLVTREEFSIDGKNLLKRGEMGIGEIFAVKENRWIEFQTPQDRVAAAARRDSIQHPYFEALFQWGHELRHFPFGTSLGQDHLAVITKEGPLADPKDPNQVAGVYRRGCKELGDSYNRAIIDDLASVGYDIEEVGLGQPPALKILPQMNVKGELVALLVKERGLRDAMYQNDMSQGMFRVLSMIIHLNFAVMGRRPSCILVDDIGEGLDFDRSCRLIKLLMDKA